MNNARRKELEKALEKIGEAKDIIQNVLDEEQEAFDNMPESFQTGERGEKMTDAIYEMDNAISNLEDVECAIENAMEG